MTLDKSLRTHQDQHELQAFLRYEQRLKEAYARSQNPFPRRWQPHGHGRGIQVDSEQPSSCSAENYSLD
jgi:hypothetical protein